MALSGFCQVGAHIFSDSIGPKVRNWAYWWAHREKEVELKHLRDIGATVDFHVATDHLKAAAAAGAYMSPSLSSLPSSPETRSASPQPPCTWRALPAWLSIWLQLAELSIRCGGGRVSLTQRTRARTRSGSCWTRSGRSSARSRSCWRGGRTSACSRCWCSATTCSSARRTGLRARWGRTSGRGSSARGWSSWISCSSSLTERRRRSRMRSGRATAGPLRACWRSAPRQPSRQSRRCVSARSRNGGLRRRRPHCYAIRPAC
jgi:hypothetical protein